MADEKCMISVIVPVYNVSKYLAQCLDSLAAQTMPKNKMEVILVNDGSTDNSPEICREYAEKYPFIKYFSKENEGLSATRNFALSKASGKYITYLDSDDKFTPVTIKSVVEFFEKHQNEVDAVTYVIQGYKNDRKLALHYRYRFLPKSGVYDLNEFPYISQTNINLCTKNLFENNILFDTTPNFRHEDQKYCTEVLLRKLKIGFCKEAEYMYNKNNVSSIVSTYFYAFYIFETTMKYFEDLFALYDGAIPPYVQAMFVNDINWKLKSDILFPYHYEKEEYDRALGRIKALLERVDDEVIANHPAMNKYHKCYWLKFKGNAKVDIDLDDEPVTISVGEKILHKFKGIEVIIQKPRVNNGVFSTMGFVKSPLYTFIDSPADLYVIEDGEERKLEVYPSVHSYFASKVKTANFYAFRYECDANKVKSISFVVKLDGRVIDTKLWYTLYSGLGSGFKRIVRENTLIINCNNTAIELRPVTKNKTKLIDVVASLRFIKHPRLFRRRVQSVNFREKHRVWLYYDLYSVEKDNGYYQFINDFAHNDGIERYYVLTREDADIDRLFTPEQQKYVVKMGSEKHKMLYICCERIFTAYYGLSPVNPFHTEKEEVQYKDLLRFSTIYLQHGVLHASLRQNNAVERSRAEQVVISSPFELNNYMSNYGYTENELITTGMARYDYINRNSTAKNRILFAPSWRKYLTTVVSASRWDLNESKFKASDYYVNFMKFLSDERLIKMLEEKDMYLDIKLHPVISDAKGLFDVDCDRICLAGKDVDVSDYKMFITDFSSYVFDFAYLNRAVMYYVPDYLQFKAGMNHYRELDLPFEDAFGNMVTESDKAVDEILRIADNDFIPDKKFSDRMASFYYPLDDCAENLYKYVLKK